MQRLVRRVKTALRWKQQEQDLRDELAAHLAIDTQERIEAGDPPDAAQQAARRDLGNIVRVVEDTRAAWGWTGVEQFVQDVRLAIRLLWRDRSFSLTTIVTLALCVGVNTSIFTVVRSVLLRPLPYPEPDRLVSVFESFPRAGVERAGTSVPNYLDHRALTNVFDSQALYQFGELRVGQGANAEPVASMTVTPSFFRVLRTRAARGRVFTGEEGFTGRHRVAVLSYDFAQRQSGGIENIVGRDLRLDDEPYTVVGVLPEHFTFLNPDVRVWVPLAFTAEEQSESARYSQNHQEIARLAAGATREEAQARIEALDARNVERAGALQRTLIDTGFHTRVVSLEADIVRNVGAALQLLWGGALFVLLIAAVNIISLALARATSRLKELATRRALGAARGRVTRQLVTETTVLTTVGGLIGLLVGYWSLNALSTLGLGDVPRAHEIHLDGIVVTFTLGVALALGLVIGALPAMQVGKVNLCIVLRDQSRAATGGRGATYLRRGLVAAQVALAFVLLVGAALLLASFRELLSVDPGFEAEHVLTGRVSPPPAKYPDKTALRSYTSRSLERVRRLPGVEAAGVSSDLPFSVEGTSSVIIPEGYVVSPGESLVSPNQLHVTPGYVEALRVRLKRGRLFTESDAAGAPRVVIVDEQLAERFWPGANPIGRRIYTPRHPEELARPGPETAWLEVVGVVGRVKLRGLVEDEDSRVGAYYLPYAQIPSRNIGFAIRTSDTFDSDAVTAAVQRVLVEIDPEVQLFDVVAMPERVERSLNPRKAPMLLSLLFGVLALLLASVGIYGVLAYQVGQRTREIGIRVALGSDASAILRMVVREAALLVLAGIGIGMAGAVALSSVVASQLYGVGPFDLRVTLAAIGVLVVASLAACLGPALRAARVDPVHALQP